jgi:hypothetical protein
MTIKRVTLSFPPELASDLNYVHRRIGVSKSALVSVLLGDALRDIRQLLESLPDEPDDKDLKRFRGASAVLVRERISNFQETIAGMSPDAS